MKTSNNKILYLEYLRVLCAIAVVMNHVAVVAIHYFKDNAQQTDLFVYNCFSQWSHFAVPVFLMISGYLLLNPEKSIDYKKAIGKYAKRMAFVLLLIGSIYAYMELFFASRSFSLLDIGKAVYLTLIGKTWDHMWYLYTLIGIYLVLPVLKPMYQGLPTRTIDCFLIILFLFFSILPIIKRATGFSIGIPLPVNSIFLFYFLLGGRLRTVNSMAWMGKTPVVMILMLLPLFFTYCNYMLNFHILEIMSGYTSPIIALLALSVFTLFKNNESLCKKYVDSIKNGDKIVTHIADNSFGIYIFHMLWINILYKVVGINPLEYSTLVLIPINLLVLIASDLTTMIYKKVPIIGKYI